MGEAKYLTCQEVADKLQVTLQHVYNLLDSGNMPCIDLSLPGARKKMRRIPEDSLEKWMASRMTDRRRR